MRRLWITAVCFTVSFGLFYPGVCCGQTKNSPEVQEKIDAFESDRMGEGANNSTTVTFDTFQLQALNQKREYGFSIDQFLGSVAMAGQVGQDIRKNPIPLLRKTLTGLSVNGVDEDTVNLVLFYFSRLAIKNPSLLDMYRKELDASNGSQSWPIMLILWYAHDEGAQTYLRNAAQATDDPEEKQIYKELFMNRKWADIDAESMPIRKCMDIEMLWAEYFITGEMTAIERIADQVTAKDGDIQEALLCVEAMSSLAQRGGWFDEIRSFCELRQTKATGREKELWEDILGRMKTLGDGTEVVKCPLQRIELSGKEGRAMACQAVFPKMDNNGRLNALGAYLLDGESVKHTRMILNEWWTEGGRFELLMSMEWLANEGHRTEFGQRSRQIANRDEQQRELFVSKQPKSSQAEWGIVCEYGPRLGAKTIMAWDLSRICMLGRFGYEAQYLTPLEIYRISIPTAIILQKTFDSWEEYGENFWIGRWYWRAREVDRDRAKKAVEALLAEEGSPWKKYAWEMPMN